MLCRFSTPGSYQRFVTRGRYSNVMSRSHAGGFARVTVTGYPLGGDSGLVLGVAAGDAASEVAGAAPVTGMDATPANTVGALGLFDMWGDGTLNGDSFLGVGTLRDDVLGFCESTLRYALRISDTSLLPPS